ncbi:hypothetical protein CRYUN_Cryun11dG0125800 [Craigia yunnanensis]
MLGMIQFNTQNRELKSNLSSKSAITQSQKTCNTESTGRAIDLMEKERKAGRLVLVLYPFQGHINPMLQLATILHSKGFSITIVHPELNSPNPSNHPEFTFRPIPDKLIESNVSLEDIPSLLLTVNKNCLAPFQQCMNQILHERDSNDYVAGILYDTLSYFAQSVADDLSLPGISVRTSAAATMLAFAVFPHPDGQGYTSFQDSISENQMLELDPQFLQLQHLIASTLRNSTDAMSEVRAAVTNATKSSSAIIANTMDFLEQAVVPKIKEYFPSPIFTIGPLHKLAPTRSSSLLKEDTECLSWLNKQALKSVLYVSFGSIASMDEQELIEIAWGLANSEQPFLWVIRPGLICGSEWIELLPKDFLDGVGERGRIVKWGPQRKVLAHGAVGGFWSHCGWNSTLESISEGVPMLCRPFLGDQFLNSRYICHVWKVGLELENKLERGKIKEAIKRLMLDVEGEIRKNAMDFKEKTDLCLTEGEITSIGNCATSFQSLVASLSTEQKQQPESPHELPTATFNPVPGVVLVFLLKVPLSTDLKLPVIFNLHFHFFFREPWKVNHEDVSFRGFLPVDSGVDKSRGFRGTCCRALKRHPFSGLVDSAVGHRNPTSGSSRIASFAYQNLSPLRPSKFSFEYLLLPPRSAPTTAPPGLAPRILRQPPRPGFLPVDSGVDKSRGFRGLDVIGSLSLLTDLSNSVTPLDATNVGYVGYI